MRSRIQSHQAVITAQSAFIFTVEAMQGGLHEVHHRFVGRFATHARNSLARFLFLTAPAINKDHQHARFDNVRIDGQSFNER